MNSFRPHPPLDARHLADHSYKRFHIDLGEQERLLGFKISVDDLFTPSFWGECVRARWAGGAAAGKQVLQQGDLIRVVREGEFDFELVAQGISAGGVTMAIYDPSGGPKIQAIAAKVNAEVAAQQMAAALRTIGGAQ